MKRKLLAKSLSLLSAAILTVTSCATALTVHAEGDASANSQCTTTADYTLDGTDSFGSMLSRAVSAEVGDDIAAEDAEATAYGVSDVFYDKTTQSVQLAYHAATDCTIVAAFYDESGVQMLASASTEVSSEDTFVALTVTDTVPEYFYFRAFLMSSSTLKPLCEYYDSPLYTKDMQELLASDVHDYDSDKVMNLDDDDSSNFAVFNDTVIQIQSTADKNTLVSADFDNDIYVFSKADTTLLSLKAGDVFYAMTQDETCIISKVGTIEQSGSNVTIHGTTLDMEEVFDYIKIEPSDTPPEGKIEWLDDSDGTVNYEGTYTDSSEIFGEDAESSKNGGMQRGLFSPKEGRFGNEDLSTSKGYSFTIKDKVLSGSLGIKLAPQFAYYLSLKRQYVELKLAQEFTYTIKTGNDILKVSGEKRLGAGLIFPICTAVYLTITPNFVYKVTADISVSGTVKQTKGFSVEHKDGAWVTNDISKEPVHTMKEPSVNGTFSFGLKFKVSASVVTDDLLDVGASLSIMLEITASLPIVSDFLSPQDDVPESKHACETCMSGTVSFKASLSYKISALGDLLECEGTLLQYKKKLLDFHFSSSTGFGFTKCDNFTYRTTIRVRDDFQNFIDLNRIACYIDGVKKDIFFTDGHVYLKPGKHKIKIEHKDTGASVTESIYVNNSATSIIVTFPLSVGTSSGNLSASKKQNIQPLNVVVRGYLGENVFYSWNKTNGCAEIWGQGPMWDDRKYFVNEKCSPFYDSTSIKTVTISNGVTTIGPYAFYGCTSLNSVSIPDSVTMIDDWSFSNCSSLTSINIPDSVTMISHLAFSGCSSLTSVNIPDSVTMIGHWSFSGCSSLTSVSIPNNVTGIGGSAFSGCTSLTSVNIPDSVTVIWNNAFSGCTSLTSVNIPDSVTEIGKYAFDWALRDIYYTGTETQWKEISIDPHNDWLSHVTIHYNSAAPTAYRPPVYNQCENVPCEISEVCANDMLNEISPLSDSVMSENTLVRNIDRASTGSTTSNESVVCSELIPGEIYNFYAFKTSQTDDLLASDNLLYINQYVADDNGEFTLNYLLKEACKEPVLYLVKMSPDELTTENTEVTVKPMTENGENQFVELVISYNGNTLIEGVDYKLCGTYMAANAGTYTVTVCGIENYCGEFDVNYSIQETTSSVILGDVNNDGKVRIADCVLLSRYVNEEAVQISAVGLKNADCDCDGCLTNNDLTMILKHIARLIDLSK